MERPHAALEAASGPTPARRRRLRWVAVLAVVVLAAGIAAVAYAAAYDPLCHHAGCTGPGGVTGPNVEKLGSFDPPAGPPVTAYRSHINATQGSPCSSRSRTAGRFR